MSVLVTSGSQKVYGAAIWDPVALAGKTDNVFGLLFALHHGASSRPSP